MDDDVYAEAVKELSQHHAPYPDSLDNTHHHHHYHHQVHHRHTVAAAGHDHTHKHNIKGKHGVDIKDPKYGTGHVHISEYQKQLHHFDYEDRHHAQTQPPQPRQPVPQPQQQQQGRQQPQQQQQQATGSSDKNDGYLKLSFKFFKQPLTNDYYAGEDRNAPELSGLTQFRQPAQNNGQRKRAGPAQ
ncbi:hypothetical protein BGX24_010958 [Mortierella sp. AD032]|nr:hypothetical protein BGX24_010958 [Mortierella sp. AD032]